VFDPLDSGFSSGFGHTSGGVGLGGLVFETPV
jgi:hypothetical protein